MAARLVLLDGKSDDGGGRPVRGFDVFLLTQKRLKNVNIPLQLFNMAVGVFHLAEHVLEQGQLYSESLY